MLCLPDELILDVAGCLDSVQDLSVLAQVNRRLLRCVEPLLYTWPGGESMAEDVFPHVERSLPLPTKALEWGTYNGREDVVSKALEYNQDGIDLALREAFVSDNEELWSLLLPIYSVEKYGTDFLEAELIQASYLDKLRITDALIKSGKLDFDAMRARRRSPLWRAAGGNNFEIFELLVETGSFDIDMRDDVGRTPFSWAASGGADEIIKLLLNTGKVDINSLDKFLDLPLNHALSSRCPEAAMLILDAGAVDVDVRDSQGITPLMSAAMLGDERVVQKLLDTGAVDINAQDYQGSSALHFAVAREKVEVVALLLATKDIEVNPRDPELRTPIMHAVATANVEMTKVVLSAEKVDVDARDIVGGTALLHAVYIECDPEDQERIVDMLLATGKADIHAQANDGMSPLILTEKLERMNLHKKMLDWEQASKDDGKPES